MPDRYLDDRGFVIDGTDPDDGLPAHLHPDAIAGCTLCDADGYRGANVCDHQDHFAETENGRALVHAELAKLRRRKTDQARDTHTDSDSHRPEDAQADVPAESDPSSTTVTEVTK